MPTTFDRLIGGHRSSGRGYRRVTWIVAVVGLALALAGIGAASFMLLAVGLVLALSASLAWKKAVEEEERADGLDVLRDEWLEAPSSPEADHLLALVRRLYAA